MTTISPIELGKKAAGFRAAEFVQPGMTIGVGTGSTVAHFIDALSASDELRNSIKVVPTSLTTAEICAARGFNVLADVMLPKIAIDLVVDGADEVDPNYNQLIKGGGGAHFREKIVAAAALRTGGKFVVIADDGKMVTRLGEKFAVPLEVPELGIPAVCADLRQLGDTLVGFSVRDGKPGVYGFARTERANVIIDVRLSAITDREISILSSLVGQYGHGIFPEMADRVILGRNDGTISELVASEDKRRLIAK